MVDDIDKALNEMMPKENCPKNIEYSSEWVYRNYEIIKKSLIYMHDYMSEK